MVHVDRTGRSRLHNSAYGSPKNECKSKRHKNTNDTQYIKPQEYSVTQCKQINRRKRFFRIWIESYERWGTWNCNESVVRYCSVLSWHFFWKTTMI